MWLAVGVAGAAAVVERQPPMVTLSSVTVKRSAASGGYAGSVDVRVRVCLSVGPGAVFVIEEKRKVSGMTKASDRWVDPLGVDLDRVYPYECVSGYQLSWTRKARLSGPGTYAVTIRVRDGYRSVSAPVSFSVSPA